MTGEEAIEELKKGRPKNWDLHRDIRAFDEAVDTAIEALKHYQKWIPISEKLPEEFKSVLVCYKSQGGMAQCVSERIVGFLDGNTRWSALCGQEPIAWMPLPEPYKAESEV